jgi:hypothetical protein
MTDPSIDAFKAVPLGSDDFSLVFLPDPQFYSQDYPEIFNAQTQWCVDNAEVRKIKMVLCAGDNVHNPLITSQWDNAQAALNILQTADLPNLTVNGNHDIPGYNPTGDLTTFNTYFPATRYTSKSWFSGGFKEEGRSENLYTVLTVGANTYLFLALQMDPSAAVITWAEGIINANSDKTVIVLTHAYMAYNGVVLPNEVALQTMLKAHANVLFVCSGHIPDPGSGYENLLATGGNRMHEFACNYQDNRPNGGNGYLRIITIKPSRREMLAETYSPYVGQYDEGNQRLYLMRY